MTDNLPTPPRPTLSAADDAARGRAASATLDVLSPARDLHTLGLCVAGSLAGVTGAREVRSLLLKSSTGELVDFDGIPADVSDPRSATAHRLTLPLTSTGETLGILLLHGPFAEDTPARANGAAGVLGLALGAVLERERRRDAEAESKRLGARAAAADAAHGERSGLARDLDRAERRCRVLAILNEMGEFLHGCDTRPEAQAAVQAFGARLFPRDAGALYALEPTRGRMETVAAWGLPDPEGGPLAPTAIGPFDMDGCQALRRGRAYYRERASEGPGCAHVGNAAAEYICVPMMAHGETVGVLHLRRGLEIDPLLSAAEPWDDRTDLAMRAAEDVALALANLKLRDRLRAQAERDPLTGLSNRRHLREQLGKELRRGARSGRSTSVACFNLRGLEAVTEEHGQPAADAVLTGIGEMIRTRLRGHDTVARWGPETIMAVLCEAPSEAAATKVEQLRAAVAGLPSPTGLPRGLGLWAEAGVAAALDHGSHEDDRLAAAEVAAEAAARDGVAGGGTRVAAPPAGVAGVNHGSSADKPDRGADIVAGPAE